MHHGIGASEAGGTIRLTASRVADDLVVEVTDDGPGLSPAEPSARRGIGLDNTRARLRQLYGERASLSIANRDAAGAVVTVVLPYHAAPAAAPGGPAA